MKRPELFTTRLRAATILAVLAGAACLAPPPDAAGAPQRYSVHGIDVSHWQGRVDWPRVVDSGIRFAFMKATEGYNFRDPQFERNWRALANTGVLRGAYHFLALDKDGARQAQNFIRTVGQIEDSDLAPVLDVETYYFVPETESEVATALQAVDDWLRVIEEHYGRRPIIYTNEIIHRLHLRERYPEHEYWFFNYQQEPMSRQAALFGLYERQIRYWSFWQYSESGRVPGIRGNVDLNVYRGTREELQESVVRSRLR